MKKVFYFCKISSHRYVLKIVNRLYFILPIALFSIASCKRGDGHAKPDEKAELLQLEPQIEEMEIPKDLVAFDGSRPMVADMPTTDINPGDNSDATVLVVPNRPPPDKVVIVPDTVDPEPIPVPVYKGFATDSIPESEISAEDYTSGIKRFQDVKNRATEPLNSALAAKGLKLGDPVFLRAIKEEKVVELFMKSRTSSKYQLVHTYKIAAMSGTLGPKKQEGDLQVPEGFYFVPARNFKPNSTFHLAFNIGYPNTYDRAHNCSGTAIMMHGNQVSIGCFAMTDPVIEEIYTLCHAAITSGSQRYFRFHSFPFRMTNENLAKVMNSPHFPFWRSLKKGYDYFEKNQLPPNVDVIDSKYVISSP